MVSRSRCAGLASDRHVAVRQVHRDRTGIHNHVLGAQELDDLVGQDLGHQSSCCAEDLRLQGLFAACSVVATSELRVLGLFDVIGEILIVPVLGDGHRSLVIPFCEGHATHEAPSPKPETLGGVATDDVLRRLVILLWHVRLGFVGRLLELVALQKILELFVGQLQFLQLLLAVGVDVQRLDALVNEALKLFFVPTLHC